MRSINLKIVGLVLVGLAILYYYRLMTAPRFEIVEETKVQLDSLNRLTKYLQANQVKYDSIIKVQEDAIEKVDSHVNSIKEKTLIIREYHHDIIQNTSKYNTQQIDSFFKSRYGY